MEWNWVDILSLFNINVKCNQDVVEQDDNEN